MTDRHDGTDGITVKRRRELIRNTAPACFPPIGYWQIAVVRAIAERHPHAPNVMLALIEHGTPKPKAMPKDIFPSIEGIERRTGLTASTIQRCLKALRGVGLLRWRTGRQGRSNRYELVTDSLAAIDAATDRLIADAAQVTGPGAAQRLVRKLIELAGFRKKIEASRARASQSPAAPLEASPSWSQVTGQVVMGDQSGGHGRPSQVVMGDQLPTSLDQHPCTNIQTTTRDRLDADDGERVVVGGSSIEGGAEAASAAASQPDQPDQPEASQRPPERSEAADPPGGSPEAAEAIRAILQDRGVMGKPLDELTNRLAGLRVERADQTYSVEHLLRDLNGGPGLIVSVLRRMTDQQIIEKARDHWFQTPEEIEAERMAAEAKRQAAEAEEAERQRRWEEDSERRRRDAEERAASEAKAAERRAAREAKKATEKAASEAQAAEHKLKLADQIEAAKRGKIKYTDAMKMTGGQGGNMPQQTSEAAA